MSRGRGRGGGSLLGGGGAGVGGPAGQRGLEEMCGVAGCPGHCPRLEVGLPGVHQGRRRWKNLKMQERRQTCAVTGL